MKRIAIIKLAIKSNYLLYIIIGILMVVIVYWGTASKEQQNFLSESEDTQLSAIIIDQDNSPESLLVVQRLKEGQLVHVIEMDDYEKALKSLFRQDVEAIFIIQPEFGEKIKSGQIKESVELQFMEGNITSELIGEFFGREMFRVFVTEKGVQNIRNHYRDVDEEFTQEMFEQAIANTERFWEGDLTISMDISYATFAKDVAPKPVTFQTIGVDVCIYTMFFIGIFLFANDLIVQRQQGVMKRLKLQGVSDFEYSFWWLGTKIILMLLIFASLSLIIQQLSFANILFYCGLMLVGGVGAWVLSRLPSGKNLFSLIPLLAIILALAFGIIPTL